jgi:uridine kinase
MPGWYLWILPFFAVFFATYNFAPRVLLGLMIVFYFITMPAWITVPEHLSGLFYGIGFSLLQLVVLTILVFIYMMVITDQAPFERRLRPIAIGIAGNSGTGKNLISHSLENLFGLKTTRILEGDDYHKWERGNIKWQEYTHLHPRANHLMDLKEHINSLIQGKLIFQRHYDHSSGKFTEPRPLQPPRTLIVQGLHTLYLKSVRDDFDLKIYISPHESIRTAWKVKRDCGERGYSLEKVLQSMKSREKDTQLYVQPQREVADLVIEYIPLGELKPEEVLGLAKIPYKLKMIVWNDHSLESLLENLMAIKTIQVDVVDGDDINQIGVVLHGEISSEQIKTIADKVITNQRSITRSRQEPNWDGGYLGLVQLFIIKLLSERV